MSDGRDRRIRILLLEDEQDVVDLFLHSVRDAMPEADVYTTTSADTALSIAQRDKPHAIVLDHSSTTTEFVANLRRSCSGVVMALFSALDDKTLRDRGRWLGMPAFPKRSLPELIAFLRRSCG